MTKMFAKILSPIAARSPAGSSARPDAGIAHRRRLFRRRSGALHVEMADEAVHIGPSPSPKAICAPTGSSRPRKRAAPRPSIRATASSRKIPISPSSGSGRARLHRPVGRRHPRHGPEGRGQAADGEGRRAGGPRLSRRGAGPMLAGQGARDRLSRADQGAAGGGGKGMRRSTIRTNSPRRWPARGARRRRAFGDDRVLVENTSPSRGISRCRFSATISATPFISSSATVRRSAATRR